MNALARKPAAFHGLGAMGLPIAERLASLISDLAVTDPVPARVAALRTRAPAVSDDPERAMAAEVVFLCLPTPDTTRAVVERLLAVKVAGRTIIDFGAQPPDVAEALADQSAAVGAAYCDAPVFGSPQMATRGDLYFLVSGPEAAGGDFAALAASVGYRARYVGPTGTASTIKILQNALGTANLAAAAEALRVCEAAGIETSTFIDVVRECDGIGLSVVFDRFAEDMATRRDSGEGRLRIAAKDSAAAAALAARHGTSAAVLEESAAVFGRAAKAGRSERQFTDIVDDV